MHSLRPNLAAGIPHFAILPDGVYDLALGNGSAYEVGLLRSDRGLYVAVGGYGFYGQRPWAAHHARWTICERSEPTQGPVGATDNSPGQA